MFKCQHCFKIILSLDSYIVHLRSHPDLKILSCCFSNCNRKYALMQSYRSHLQRCKYNLQEKENISENSNLLETENVLINENIFENVNILENEDFLDNEDFPDNEYYHREVEPQNISTIEPTIYSLDKMELDVLKIALNMYNENYFARKNVLKILKQNFELFTSQLNFLYEQISNADDFNTKTDILAKIQELKSYYLITTERKFFKKLKLLGYLVYPKSITISREIVPVNKNNSIILMEKNVTIQLTDLVKLFQQLFNKTNILNDILDFLSSLDFETDLTSNFIQTDTWKKKVDLIRPNQETLLLPLFVFSDDYECNNCLGSHAGKSGKVCGVYIMIPCLPESLQSKLSQIFVAMQFLSKDRKISNGNTRIFAPLIDMLNVLQEEGINVNHGKYKNVKLITSLVLGDNLGLNQILGFTEGFTANFFCRICRMHNTLTRQEIYQDISIFRNRDNYKSDVEINNSRLTGIKSESVFNKLKYFHVVDNSIGDLMHDWAEGICHYDMLIILRQFIYEEKFFSLEILNQRIKSHDYGQAKNKPLEITHDLLLKDKLKYSASEMYCFILNFNCLVGDFIKSIDDKYWRLYLLLREIVIILHQKQINNETIYFVEQLIAEHHELYLECFNYLRPKYHFGTHYGYIMRMVGPVSLVSSIRYEAKHQQSKEIARSSRSRKNLLYTLALRHQLKIANFTLNYNRISADSKQIVFSENTSIKVFDFLAKYNITLNEGICKIYKWIEFLSIKYKPGFFIQTGYNQYDLPIYNRIIKIISLNGVFFFCIEVFTTVDFDNHLKLFYIEANNKFHHKCFDDLKNKKVYNSISFNDNLCINSI